MVRIKLAEEESGTRVRPVQSLGYLKESSGYNKGGGVTEEDIAME